MRGRKKMTRKFLKSNAISLLSILAFITTANAGRVNFINLDIDQIDGKKVTGSFRFTGENTGNQSIPLPPVGQNMHKLVELTNDTYNNVSLLVWSADHTIFLSTACDGFTVKGDEKGEE